MIRFQRKRIYNNPGSIYRIKYALKYSSKTNADELVPIGKEPWQEMIDAAAASCDISTIMQRVKNGEVNLLRQREAVYGDFTEMPMDKQAMLQNAIDARYFWNNLPEDQKKNFGSFSDFLEDAGSVKWLQNLGVLTDEQNDTKDEVKNDEN